MANYSKNLVRAIILVILCSVIAAIAYAAPSLSTPSEVNFGEAARNATKSVFFTNKT